MTARLTWLAALRQRDGRAPSAPPIGVDFGHERLNLMQTHANGTTSQAPTVRAAASLPYPMPREHLLADPRALRRFVRTALASAPFSGQRVYSALAAHDVRILPMTVAVAAGQSEAQAVARAAHAQIGDAVSDAVVDYFPIRSIDGDSAERQVLVAVAGQQQVLAHLATLHAAGLDPVALDIGPAAIGRLLGAMGRDDLSQSVLLINFGLHKSYLTVVWGRRLMLDREIDFGEVRLTDKLAAALALPAHIARTLMQEHGIGADQTSCPAVPGGGKPHIGSTIREILHPEFRLLAEELLRTQVYVASRTRGSTLSRVYLNGSVARYPHMVQRLGDLVALPVEVLDPFDAFAATPFATPAIGKSIALAAGLALRQERHG